MMPTPGEPVPFEAPQLDVADLRNRLANAVYPTTIDSPESWESGTDLGALKSLAEYWRKSFDFKAFQQRLDRFPQFTISLNGLERVHFVHVRSRRPDAIPMIMLHGWPGSYLEFTKVIEPLTDPGDDAQPAFHVVVPSLPGFGFSSAPQKPGFGVIKIAETFDMLMEQLGYSRYIAQGGDMGSQVARSLGIYHSDHCVGVHMNMIAFGPKLFSVQTIHEILWLIGFPNSPGKDYLDRAVSQYKAGCGYQILQVTKPQTLAPALIDSPLALLSWHYEKFAGWTDPRRGLSDDEILSHISLYWFTKAGGTSIRLYKEHMFKEAMLLMQTYCPTRTSHCVYPYEIMKPLRCWVQPFFNLVRYTQAPEGGHFAADENPTFFVKDVRASVPALLEPVDKSISASVKGFLFSWAATFAAVFGYDLYEN